MEFAAYGNLRDYLRQYAGSRDREPSDDVISGSDDGTLTHGDLLSFAVQVARGLQFLTSQSVSNESSTSPLRVFTAIFKVSWVSWFPVISLSLSVSEDNVNLFVKMNLNT